MEWKELLCDERIKPKAVIKLGDDNAYTVPSFDQDMLEIASSQSFRRMQDKTQVFMLDNSDFVRTRLTHSMEVSTIAQHICSMICAFLQKEKPAEYEKCIHYKEGSNFQHDIETVSACAGLLHDTGNPPFGHYGESVIRKWFKDKFNDPAFAYGGKPISDILNEQMKLDFMNFEGNAQGLRLLSKVKNDKNSYDVNLTYAVINTLIKYPNSSADFNASDKDVKKHKNGFFYSEEKIMDSICSHTGTKTVTGYARHPLVYVMEAADDIAYCTADLEDSVMKNSFGINQFINYYQYKSDEELSRQIEKLIEENSMEQYRDILDAWKRIILAINQENLKSDYNDNTETKRELSEIQNEISSQFDEEIQFRLADISDNYFKLIRPVNKSLRMRLKYGFSYSELINNGQNPEVRKENTQEDFAIFEQWLSDRRNYLIFHVAKSFVDHYEEIMAGEYQNDLFAGTEEEKSVAIMKSMMNQYVYDSSELIDMEISAKQILEQLLEKFVSAILYYDETSVDGRKMSLVDDRFIHKIPDNLLYDYQMTKNELENTYAENEERLEAEKLYHRLLIVTDYISGMTDRYAANLYKIVNGGIL